MTHAHSIVVVLIGSTLVLGGAQEKKADEQPKQAPAGSSLDRQLLDDLSKELLNKSEKTKPSKNGKTPKSLQNVDRGPSASAGEDVGGSSKTNPLELIGEKMRRIEEELLKRNTSLQTQAAQSDVVERLAVLIEQIQQQQRQQQDRPSSQPTPANQKPPAEQNALQENSLQNKKATATAGAPNAQKANAPLVGKGDNRRHDGPNAKLARRPPSEVMEEIWGHLPDRVRPRMPTNSRIEEFLPKYENVIVEYFNRLRNEGEK